MFTLFNNLPAHEKRITLSTFITLLRIALVPCIVMVMFQHAWKWAGLLFFVAALSDMLDGTLARWRNEQTFLGAALDPIADKFLLLSCFCTFAFIQSPQLAIPWWFVTIVLLKELIMIGGSFFLWWYKGSLEIKPTVLGKATAVLQMCFIIWLFACYTWGWAPCKTYYVLLGSMVTASLISLMHYIHIGFTHFKRSYYL